MATPKKLPSGTWRVRVFDYTDVDGKPHYRSFTGASRTEVNLKAAEWEKDKSQQKIENITIYVSVTRYIDAKRHVLSPSTVCGYEKIQRNYMKDIGTVRLQDLTNLHLQTWINDLAQRISPKSVRNAFGLLSATLDMFRPDLRIRVQLPQKIKPKLYTPSDEDISHLLDFIHGTELEIAVMLAAFGPLRRGEICALTSNDIHGNFLTISCSLVKCPDGSWTVKQPKTDSGYRTIEMPDFVIDRIKNIKGRIVNLVPDTITKSFSKTLKKAGIPHFRFHDLRHYSASIMHAINVPDLYIMQRGGWASDNILKTVYQNVIDLEQAKQNRKIISHFEELKKSNDMTQL